MDISHLRLLEESGDFLPYIKRLILPFAFQFPMNLQKIPQVPPTHGYQPKFKKNNASQRFPGDLAHGDLVLFVLGELHSHR